MKNGKEFDSWNFYDSNGKLTTNGDYPNQSKFIYISDYTSLVGISKGLVPMGFGAVSSPHNSTLALDDRFKPSLDY